MSDYIPSFLKSLVQGATPAKTGTGGVVVFIVLWYVWKKKKKSLVKRFIPRLGEDLRKRPVRFDGDFVARLHYIAQTCFPSFWCRETAMFAILTVSLFTRTYLTVAISDLMALSVQKFVDQNFADAYGHVLKFQTFSIIAAFVNAGLKYVTSMLGALMRDRMTRKAHDIYMQNMNYYKANFVGANTLENTDQLIAEDIDKLSHSIADIYTNVLKPIVDLIIFTVKLAYTMEVTGPVGMYAYFIFASQVSRIVLPPYASLAAIKQKKEGEFREAEKRIINNAEMVAFMGGEIPEKRHLNDAFDSVFSHISYVARRKLFADVVMGYVNKYAASSVGFFLLCLPWILGHRKDNSAAEITSFYVKSAQLLEGLSDAVLRLFEVQKDLGKSSGLASRVYNLFYTLQNPEKLPLPISKEYPPVFEKGDHLSFKNVTVYKPDGRILVKNLTFDIPRGKRVIITGENGCGKSSLFRVLRKLWPLVEGSILQPDQEDSFYFLSQVNFVPIGSLRDIIIYPHSQEQQRRRGKSDEDLLQLLKDTRLENLELNDVKPSLDTVWDWNTALSPGQKQRMAFARLLYHCPLYAVLDECTNGVAPDVEIELYKKCQDNGITVFSISHKLELKGLHDYELHYLSDGLGGYNFSSIEGEEKVEEND